MKPEEKDFRKNAELNEEELNGVSGGTGFGAMNAQTMQYQQGMTMGPDTMEFQHGALHMQARTLEQKAPGTDAANPLNASKNSGGTHSL